MTVQVTDARTCVRRILRMDIMSLLRDFSCFDTSRLSSRSSFTSSSSVNVASCPKRCRRPALSFAGCFP